MIKISLKTTLFLIVFFLLGSLAGYFVNLIFFSVESSAIATPELNEGNRSSYNSPLSNWNLTDPGKLITISTPQDIDVKRKQLMQFIWKTDHLPTTLPGSIEKDFVDSRYKKMKYLKSIDKITTRMEFGLKSIAYHFKSSKQNKNKLVIYHGEHSGDFIYAYALIESFLKEGYDVLAFAMPLLGLNSEPIGDTGRFGNIVDIPAYGTLTLADHNTFFFVDNSTFTSIKFYVHPIAVALNYIEQQYDYESIVMTGYSGGGWTTTLYTALDPRIQKSYPTASSQPFYLISNDYDLYMGGDYETFNPELYRIADYLDLYIMGSSGENRNQIQILNLYDPCCFAGVGYKTYEDVVSDRVKSLGNGSFSVFSDDSHYEHKISDVAFEVILEDMERN